LNYPVAQPQFACGVGETCFDNHFGGEVHERATMVRKRYWKCKNYAVLFAGRAWPPILIHLVSLMIHESSITLWVFGSSLSAAVAKLGHMYLQSLLCRLTGKWTGIVHNFSVVYLA